MIPSGARPPTTGPRHESKSDGLFLTSSHIDAELCDDDWVPLSDEEERVLAELEAQLASDRVASRIHGDSVPGSPSLLVPVLSALGFLLLAVVGFVVHVAFGLVGFVGLVASLTMTLRACLGGYVDDSDHIRYY